LYSVYLHYKILHRTMYGVIFYLIWTPYNYSRQSSVSAGSCIFGQSSWKV